MSDIEEMVKRLRAGTNGWNSNPAMKAAADVLEAQAKRIAELEASLADSNEALQVMGLKLEQAEGHSANTVGGPTPVAAPACEQLADNEDAVYAVAYKLCLQDGADEDSAHTLIWEGRPPEPWGEVWMRYEFQARELLKALDERRALMANHQATFQSGHECVSRVSNSDSRMNKQDATRTAGESDR